MKTLTKLKDLVFEGLSPSNPAMTEQEMGQWLESLPGIKKEQLELMQYMVFSYYGNKLVYRHLQQVAKECTLMLDALYHCPDFPESILPLYQAVVDSLVEILNHLWSNYGQYLNTFVAMPKLLYRTAAGQIEAKAAVLVQAMSRYHADKALQSLVICKMTGLLQKGTGSWHEISCLEQLQKWILELCAGRNANITEALKALLTRADFNTEGFVQYCQASIAAVVAECYEVKGKYDLLFDYERYYSTLTNKHRSEKFVPGQPKVKVQLLAFVKAELDCMAKKEGGNLEKVIPDATTDRNRLPVTISVEALAYLFKLLLKANVITGTGKNILMVFLSKNFQTPGVGAAEISVKSLESKYRQVTGNTAIMVRSMLKSMLKELDKEFN